MSKLLGFTCGIAAYSFKARHGNQLTHLVTFRQTQQRNAGEWKVVRRALDPVVTTRYDEETDKFAHHQSACILANSKPIYNRLDTAEMLALLETIKRDPDHCLDVADVPIWRMNAIGLGEKRASEGRCVHCGKKLVDEAWFYGLRFETWHPSDGDPEWVWKDARGYQINDPSQYRIRAANGRPECRYCHDSCGLRWPPE